MRCVSGADPGFQLRGGVLKKIGPSGGRRENLGVFRVKNHESTPKIIFSPILGGRAGCVSMFCKIMTCQFHSMFFRRKGRSKIF